MAIIATNSGTARVLVDAGTYVARCYSMIDIGTVVEEYLGEKKQLHKVRIAWELPTELRVFKEENGEQPFSVSREFTLSMHEKSNLRKFLEGWRGKGFTDAEAAAFDITVLMGKECMLSIIHKVSKTGNTYAEISSVTTVPRGLTIPDQINKTFVFSWSEFDQEKFNILPDFIKDKMRQSTEYARIYQPDNQPLGSIADERADAHYPQSDDLPF